LARPVRDASENPTPQHYQRIRVENLRQPDAKNDFHLPARPASANVDAMKFLGRLAAGDVPLWRVFWLIGTPLSLVWDLSGLSLITGFGVEEPLIAAFLIAVFSLSCLALVFVAVALWRSANRYPREEWWHTPLAICAKLCAIFSALSAGVSFLIIMYLLLEFVYAAIAFG
jgi:hypothetical protein